MLLGNNILVFAVGLVRLFQSPEAALSIIVTLGWTSLNILLLSGAVGAMLERARPPGAPKVAVDVDGEFHYEDEIYPLSLVEACSASGVIRVDNLISNRLKPGASARLHFPETDTGEVNFTVILPEEEQLHGDLIEVEFAPETTGGYRGMIDLVYGSSDRWVEHLSRRTKHKGIRTAFFEVGWIAIRGLFSFIFHALRTSRVTAKDFQGASLATPAK